MTTSSLDLGRYNKLKLHELVELITEALHASLKRDQVVDQSRLAFI
jgi:hypothetical protein